MHEQMRRMGLGLEGNTNRFSVSCVADSSFGEILIHSSHNGASSSKLIFKISLLLCSGDMFSSAILKTDERWARRQDDRRHFVTTHDGEPRWEGEEFC